MGLLLKNAENRRYFKIFELLIGTVFKQSCKPIKSMFEYYECI